MGYLLLDSAAASLCALSVLPGCPCGCAFTVCLGFRVSWPSCLSFALQLALVFQAPVGSLLPYGSHPSRWGHPCEVGAVSSCCQCPWGFGHHMGQCGGWFPLIRDRRFSLVLHTLSFWMSFEPLSVAPVCARSLWGGFLVVLAVNESLRLSLALSSVLPCNMFWLHFCLHGTGSGP